MLRSLAIVLGFILVISLDGSARAQQGHGPGHVHGNYYHGGYASSNYGGGFPSVNNGSGYRATPVQGHGPGHIQGNYYHGGYTNYSRQSVGPAYYNASPGCIQTGGGYYNTGYYGGGPYVNGYSAGRYGGYSLWWLLWRI